MTFEQLGWWQQYDEKLKANVLKVAFSVYVASSVVFLATKKFQRNFSCSPNDIYRSKDVRKQRTMANIERDKHKIDKRKDIFLLIKAIFTGGFMSTKTDKERAGSSSLFYSKCLSDILHFGLHQMYVFLLGSFIGISSQTFYSNQGTRAQHFNVFLISANARRWCD